MPDFIWPKGKSSTLKKKKKATIPESIKKRNSQYNMKQHSWPPT